MTSRLDAKSSESLRSRGGVVSVGRIALDGIAHPPLNVDDPT